MPDLGSQDELLIRRMREGGYLVLSGQLRAEMFAASTVDEALAYVRGQIEPIGAEPAREHQHQPGQMWCEECGGPI